MAASIKQLGYLFILFGTIKAHVIYDNIENVDKDTGIDDPILKKLAERHHERDHVHEDRVKETDRGKTVIYNIQNAYFLNDGDRQAVEDLKHINDKHKFDMNSAIDLTRARDDDASRCGCGGRGVEELRCGCGGRGVEELRCGCGGRGVEELRCGCGGRGVEELRCGCGGRGVEELRCGCGGRGVEELRCGCGGRGVEGLRCGCGGRGVEELRCGCGGRGVEELRCGCGDRGVEAKSARTDNLEDVNSLTDLYYRLTGSSNKDKVLDMRNSDAENLIKTIDSIVGDDENKSGKYYENDYPVFLIDETKNLDGKTKPVKELVIDRDSEENKGESSESNELSLTTLNNMLRNYDWKQLLEKRNHRILPLTRLQKLKLSQAAEQIEDKRFFPLTKNQKKKLAQKIRKHNHTETWEGRRNNPPAQFGVPFEMEVEGLGQLNQ